MQEVVKKIKDKIMEIGNIKFASYTKPLIAVEDVLKIIDTMAEKYRDGWIPCSEQYPSDDSYILLSFENFSVPTVGRYEEDKEGGAFYIGDEDETCVSQELFVNAWQPLPEAYRTE